MNDPYRLTDAPSLPQDRSTTGTGPPNRGPLRLMLWILLGVLIVANVALSLDGRPILAMTAGIAVVVVLGVVVVQHLTGGRS